MQPLDNPVWHALTGAQAVFAEGGPSALRFHPDVAVFAALPDIVTPDAWDELRELVGPDGVATIVRGDVEAPSAWEEVFRDTAVQMVGSEVAGEPFPSAEAMGLADVPEMLELVQRTRPGPFAARTVEMGTYIGIRDNGVLVAMAGERVRPPGHVELSAVCTDGAYRGRGLGSGLVRVLCADIIANGDVPFLHTPTTNVAAIRLYHELGFTRRREMAVRGLRAPR